MESDSSGRSPSKNQITLLIEKFERMTPSKQLRAWTAMHWATSVGRLTGSKPGIHTKKILEETVRLDRHLAGLRAMHSAAVHLKLPDHEADCVTDIARVRALRPSPERVHAARRADERETTVACARRESLNQLNEARLGALQKSWNQFSAQRPQLTLQEIVRQTKGEPLTIQARIDADKNLHQLETNRRKAEQSQQTALKALSTYARRAPIAWRFSARGRELQATVLDRAYHLGIATYDEERTRQHRTRQHEQACHREQHARGILSEALPRQLALSQAPERRLGFERFVHAHHSRELTTQDVGRDFLAVNVSVRPEGTFALLSNPTLKIHRAVDIREAGLRAPPSIGSVFHVKPGFQLGTGLAQAAERGLGLSR